jgi:hypothetical protein
MADINQLALSAARKLAKGEALTEIGAIEKAILGVGIRDKADMKRLKSQVGRVFARNKWDKTKRGGRR